MNVAPTQGLPTGAAVSPAAASSSPTVSADNFIQLLMAQLKNQDPTHPMDPTQMVSQLATVSQVSQTQQMNSTLSQLLSTSTMSQATQLLGHTITSGDGSVTGKIVSVTVGSAGMVANLDNGSTIALQGDYKISV